MNKTGKILLFGGLSLVVISGIGYAMYSKSKKHLDKSKADNNNNNNNQNTGGQETSAKVEICTFDKMNNGYCDLNDNTYIEFLKKVYPLTNVRKERYAYLLAGTNVSPSKIETLASWSTPVWLYNQAKGKVSKGEVNELLNAIIVIQLWNQQKNLHITKKQLDVASDRLYKIDKSM